MSVTRLVAGFAPVAALVLALATPAECRAGPPAGYRSVVLDNGLRVSVLADPAHPVVATQVWYHVGSANEDAGSRGFAHLFEHLMFGRTSRHERDEYAALHHRAGGYENAYTSWDETVYVSEIAPDDHGSVLELEADRMVNLVLDADNLANEQRIVTEELRLRTRNDPFNRVMVAALEAVLGGHPYAHTPAGTPEEIAAATLGQCARFYARYYRPRNAHLVVVGPVDPDATLVAVRHWFGPLPADGETPPDVPALIDWSFPEDVVLEEDLPPVETALYGFPLPPAGSVDRWALAVLEQLLAGGQVDPFAEILVERRRKAVFAQTTWLTMRRGGAVVFAAAHLPYRRRATAFRLADRARDELAQLAWLTEESLAGAKRALLRQELQRTYFAESRAAAIGRAQWWLGDERSAFEAAERIEAVTREQVAAAFRRYISEAEPVRVYLRPERVPWYVRWFGWLYPLVSR